MLAARRPLSASQIAAAVRQEGWAGTTKREIKRILLAASDAKRVERLAGDGVVPSSWRLIPPAAEEGQTFEITMPKSLTHNGLLYHLEERGVLRPPSCELHFVVPEDFFVIPSAMSLWCSWILEQKRKGSRVIVHGENQALRYLARMNFFAVTQLPHEEDFERHSVAGRFMPLQQIESTKDCWKVISQLGDLILHQFDNAREFFPAMEWAVNEVVDNIVIHSESQTPGVVCAQFYPEKHFIQIGICDMGRGIKASLSESHSCASHSDALALAIKRGVTRNPDIGQGNGLAGTLAIAEANGGGFHLWSGDACLKIAKGVNQGCGAIPPCQGTGIYMNLRTDKPVDLRRTFIGASGFSENESTYIFVESERVTVGDGLAVKQECFHTGSRPPATALRRKIVSILPDIDRTPLILNFAGVESASSSFLDELLARLVIQMGVQQFKAKIRVVNIAQQLKEMANVVIKQRLEAAPEMANQKSLEEPPNTSHGV